MSKRKSTLYEEPLTALRMVRDAHLPHSVGHVLMMLLIHADDKGHCYPSQALLALETGLHKATVVRALRRLQDAKVVHRHYRQGTSNYYTLALTRPKLATLTSRTMRTDQSHKRTRTAHELPNPPQQDDRRRAKCSACGNRNGVWSWNAEDLCDECWHLRAETEPHPLRIN